LRGPKISCSGQSRYHAFLRSALISRIAFLFRTPTDHQAAVRRRETYVCFSGFSEHPTVDTNGDLVYFYKMDQTQIASISVSLGKARTAARYRRPSEIFFNQMQTQAGAFYATLGDPPPVASPGGFPLIEGGKIIGAIGCSGATGAQDAVACKAGADSLK
jgi:glc operon protein GlcG